MSEYLNTVREVERRIQQAEKSAAESPLTDLTRPTSVPDDWEEHVKLMFDMQILALRADLTRVITFQMAVRQAHGPIRRSAYRSRIT